MKKEDGLGGEPAEEMIEITPKKSYWKFVLGVSVVGIFALGYCLGGSCNSVAGTENVFGKLLSGTVSVSNQAFSNIFGNGSENSSENLRETIDLNKEENRSGSSGTEKKTVEVVSERPRSAEEVQTPIPIKQTETVKECRFDSIAVPSHDKLIISEVAWMGSSINPRHEWVELQNISGGEIDISRWQVLDSDEKVKIIFSKGTLIPPQGFFLLKRGDESLPQIKADYVYSGGLENEGDGLRLFDSSCSLIDEIIANPTWPAGSASPKYLSAERSPDLSWHSYEGSGEAGIYGTPRKPNSKLEPPQPTQNQSPTSSSGGGVSGTPTESTPPPFPPPPPPPPSPQTERAINHVLISEIFYDALGSDTGKEFIELYNPTNGDINLTDWSLRNGTTSLAKFGSNQTDTVIIKSNKFLLIGLNSYNGSPSPDVLRSSALPNTSAAIRLSDSSGTIIDSVSYNNSVSEGQSYERVSWSTNEFKPEPNPTPQNSQSL